MSSLSSVHMTNAHYLEQVTAKLQDGKLVGITEIYRTPMAAKQE